MELPTRLVVFTDDFYFVRPILFCREVLSTEQLDEAYRAIEEHERPDVEECGLCKLLFEI